MQSCYGLIPLLSYVLVSIVISCGVLLYCLPVSYALLHGGISLAQWMRRREKRGSNRLWR